MRQMALHTKQRQWPYLSFHHPTKGPFSSSSRLAGAGGSLCCDMLPGASRGVLVVEGVDEELPLEPFGSQSDSFAAGNIAPTKHLLCETTYLHSPLLEMR